jgi:hypothetical protein
VSFAAINLCVTSQRVLIVVSVYFLIDSGHKLLDTPSYVGLGSTAYSFNLFFCDLAICRVKTDVKLPLYIKGYTGLQVIYYAHLGVTPLAYFA